MPVVRPGPRFAKAVQALVRRDAGLEARIRDAVERFRADVHHPGLNFEKIKGSQRCTIRVSRGVRIMLAQSGPDTFDLIDVGDHDHIYGRKN